MYNENEEEAKLNQKIINNLKKERLFKRIKTLNCLW